MNDMSRRITPAPAEAPAGPAPRRPRTGGPIGVLDIGTTKIVCLIGRIESDGELRLLGTGWQRGRGVRAGAVTDVEEAERAIRAAVGAAEEMADTRLSAVGVNLSCGAPETRAFNVQLPIGGRRVGDDDLRRAVAEARSRAATDGRVVIQSLPLGFTVDEADGVEDPRGLHCDMLGARMAVLDAGAGALRNLTTTLARCDLGLRELVAAPLAAGLSALVEDERRLGAVVIDMGGGTTSVGVFADGHMVHAALVPVGGQHVTNDVARMLSTTVAHAERLKTLFGGVGEGPDDARELLPVPLVGEDEHAISKVPRAMLVNIIRPRLEETFELVRDRIGAAGLGRDGESRIVLTGGGSQLIGARDLAQRIFGRPVRNGRPAPLRGLPDAANAAPFAVAAGLLAWSAGRGRVVSDLDLTDARPEGRFRRFVHWLKDRV